MFKLILPLAIIVVLIKISGLENNIDNLKLKKYIKLINSIVPASPFLCLVFLFITNNENYLYVATHGSEDLPIRFRISAVWAAREGPLLLWAACCSLISFIQVLFPMKEPNKLSLKILDCFILCLLLIAYSLDPFRLTPENSLVISAGLNPLLQTNLMVVHPPLIFAFYSSCIWIGCISISKMVNYDSKWDTSKYLDEIHKPALISFFLGSLGIGLGGFWAYTVLDWGGYWAWDPVETASLLPWIAVMILLHLRLKQNKLPKEWLVLVGISPLWFSILATIVTRAGGVWAGSVHSFVVNSDSLENTNLWERLLILKADDIAGIEIMTYLLILVGLFGLYSGTFLNQKISEINGTDKKNNNNIFLLIFSTVLIGPILVFLGVFKTNMWGTIPIQIPLMICGIVPVFIPFIIQKNFVLELLKFKNLTKNETPLKMMMVVGIIGLVIWIGDVILGGLLIASVLFSICYKKLEDGWPWIIGSIFLLLFGSWSNLIEIYEAGIGILLLSVPWVIMSRQEDENTLSLRSVIYWSPIIVSSVYLLLTWIILLSSIDGPRFEAHELFGAPILFFILCGLSALSLQNKMEDSSLVALLIFVSITSIIFAWFLGEKLPSDSANTLGGPIIRGHIVWLLMPIALMALPALISLISSIIKKRTKGHEKNSLKLVFAHIIHLGIVILIIGHLFATTTIDRNDMSHQITLVRNEVTSYGSFEYTFEDVVILKKSESEFEKRFDVGDGYIGTIIKISDNNGKSTKIEPGVLRFDMPFETFPRSEVDRAVKFHGDIVVIFDLSQSQAMENMQNNELENLQQIRVTIYELPGSHLVWGGWMLTLLGSMALIGIPSKKIDPLDS